MKREPSPHYGPCCGEALEYADFYRCPACKKPVDIKDMVLPERAAQIRRELGQGDLFSEMAATQAARGD